MSETNWDNLSREDLLLIVQKQFAALTAARTVIDTMFRSFFRYAQDLLFSPRLGNNWHVCPNGHMLGGHWSPGERRTCWICGDVMRPIQWRGLNR